MKDWHFVNYEYRNVSIKIQLQYLFDFVKQLKFPHAALKHDWYGRVPAVQNNKSVGPADEALKREK